MLTFGPATGGAADAKTGNAMQAMTVAARKSTEGTFMR
jgi:hypothetical protein